MMLRRILVIAQTELRLIVREPAWPAAFTLMPLGLITVLNAAFSKWIRVNMEVPNATGSELSVAGQAALFNIMMLANFGLILYRDHSTGVWDRVRAGLATPGEVISGKLLATWCAHLFQFLLLLALAQPLFQLRVSDHLVALLLLSVATVTATVALGFLLFSFINSSNAFEATAMMGSMVLGALGGAFAPRDSLPAWSVLGQKLSPVTWTVEGFQRLFIGHEPETAVLQPSLILFGMATACVIGGMARFNANESKAKNR